MSQPPEYERNSTIKSSGVASGASQAFHPNMEKVRGHLGWAEFGRQLSQGAANERAKLNAIEAAQNPGRTLLPAITEADKVFHQVYKDEELQVVSSHANSLLQQIYKEADGVKTPSMSTLQEFEKNAMEGFEKFLDQVSPENKPRLERALRSAYEANYAQLAVKLEKYNTRLLNAQYNKGIDQSMQDVQNYMLMGNFEAAKDAKTRALGFAGTLEREGHDLPDVAHKKREGIEELAQIAYYQKKTEDAIKDGKYESFIRNLREDPPEHLKPLVRENVIKASMQYANQYQAALTGQQNLEYLTYEKAMVEGSLTPTMMAEGEKRMGAHHFAQLELQLAKKSREENELNVLVSQVTADSNSVDKMSKYSGKQVSDVFKNLVSQYEQSYGMEPGSLPLIGQAQIAELIKAPNSDLANKVQAQLVGGDAKSAAEAAQVVATLKKNNPLALSGLSKQENLLALGIDRAVSSGMQPELAAELKRQRVLGLDEKGIEERENKYASLTKGSKAGNRNFDDPNKAASFVQGSMGFNGYDLPVGMTETFLETLKDNFIACGDWDDSVTATVDVFSRTYGIWDDQVMHGAPSIFVPYGTDAEDVIKNDFLDKFQVIEESSKKMYEAKGSDFYYEVDKNFLDRSKPEDYEEINRNAPPEALLVPDQFYIDNPDLKKKFLGNRPRIKKIFRNGEVQEGELVIKSDRWSTIPETGVMPNYWVGMKINKRIYDVINPSNNQAMRLQPNVDKYIEYQSKLTEKEKEEQRKLGRSHQETLPKVRKRAQELRENPSYLMDSFQ